MNRSLFEYCVNFGGHELWLGGYEPAVIRWYDRSGAIEAISDLRVLEERVFLDFVFGATDSWSTRRLARERENYTITVEISGALFLEVLRLARLNSTIGMTMKATSINKAIMMKRSWFVPPGSY